MKITLVLCFFLVALDLSAQSTRLYVPAVMDLYEGSTVSIITSIMHERDHLTEMGEKLETEVNLEKEIHLHALTTEFVTVPLKEKCGVALSPNYQRHYDAWVRSGQSEKSPIWRQYMRELHSHMLPGGKK